MLRPVLGHYQVYYLCLGAEFLFFSMDPYFEYDYITCNIMLGNKKVQHQSTNSTPDDDPITVETCRVFMLLRL
jgi:hypothetical protein